MRKTKYPKISFIKIIPNIRKRWAVELSRDLSDFLKKHGFEIIKDNKKNTKNSDATICIGGDGTIFYANHLNKIRGAVLGIGSVSSVVCQLKRNNKKNILKILKNPKTEKRLALNVEYGKKTVTAINDVVIHSSDYRVIRIFLSLDKKQYDFDGDGLIIATPTGSTAYAYSAGGKIIRNNQNKIGLVPICPYKRTFSPLSTSNKANITVSSNRGCSLIVDGIFISRLKEGQKINVSAKGNLDFLVQ